MKQFFKITLACVLGLFICSLLWVLLTISIIGAAGSGESVTTVKPNSVYELELDGVVSERSDEDPFSAALYEAMGQNTMKSMGLDDILSNIEKAKNNENIVGIYLNGGNLMAGYATMKEIRDALLKFKESGKFIVAYSDGYTQPNYYLASVADKIMLNPIGSIDWRGLHSQITFYTKTLEKLGIEMQIVKVGTFKSAVEPYINTQMSPANRLQMQQMIDGIWETMLTEVSASRNISNSKLNAYADEMMMFQAAEKNYNYQLVDSLIYSNEVDSILKCTAMLDSTEQLEKVKHKAMCSVATDKKFKKDKIAIIYAEGSITDNEGDGIVGRKLIKTINEVAENKNVKSVVLRVNSPGGSAYASEQIWNALVNLKAKKPLVVSMGDYAASGGYYISCMADTIVAQPSTLTGSIGVFSMIPNFSEIYDKIGIKTDDVKTNKMSDMYSNITTHGMNAQERALLQQTTNQVYELFVKRCADGRGMSTEAIKAIGEGRVWLGKTAVEKGLVDVLGGIDDAIKVAAKMATLDEYAVAAFPEKEDPMTQLLNSFSKASIYERIAKSQLGQNYEWMNKIKEMTEQSGVQAIMPFNIQIR